MTEIYVGKGQMYFIVETKRGMILSRYAPKITGSFLELTDACRMMEEFAPKCRKEKYILIPQSNLVEVRMERAERNVEVE